MLARMSRRPSRTSPMRVLTPAICVVRSAQTFRRSPRISPTSVTTTALTATAEPAMVVRIATAVPTIHFISLLNPCSVPSHTGSPPPKQVFSLSPPNRRAARTTDIRGAKTVPGVNEEATLSAGGAGAEASGSGPQPSVARVFLLIKLQPAVGPASRSFQMIRDPGRSGPVVGRAAIAPSRGRMSVFDQPAHISYRIAFLNARPYTRTHRARDGTVGHQFHWWRSTDVVH